MSSSATLVSDPQGLNDLFLTHQINSLKLTDQRTFIDSLAQQRNQSTCLHLGDLVDYAGKVYWIEEDCGDHFLLKRDDQVKFVQKSLPIFKRKGHRLLEIAKQKLEKGEIEHSETAELYRLSQELRFSDSKHYASVKGSKIAILPHQINAVYQILNSLNHRFLLADEVGLGKTIEMGLLLKEFVMRYNYDKILVVVPATLQVQWQNELWEKFSESFSILDARSLKKESQGEVREYLVKHSRVLISLDFAKQDHIAEELSKPIWDMVVFDEAHRLRRDRTKITRAYTFAEKISYRTKSFFLLSATPFSGKIEELYFFLSLLCRNHMGSLQSFIDRYYTEGGAFLSTLIAEVTIRRTKKQVGGFTRRHAVTVKYRLSHLEKAFYDRMEEYVRTEYNKAMEAKSGARTLMLVFFQKMMDSSLDAIQSALTKRIHLLKNQIAAQEGEKKALKKIYKNYFNELAEEMDDEDDLDGMDEKAQTLAELKTELLCLEELHMHSRQINENSKAKRLLKVIQGIMRENPEEKVIIFTQFKSTMFAIQDMLSEHSSVCFHGSLSRDEKDQAVEDFRHHIQIFIATEAGGEGRNLQFSKTLINYDLPWNPFKVEQRIGRVHRFGQKHDVRILNFAMEESIGERIIEILTDKLKVFEDAFGETEAVLGMVDGGVKSFDELFMRYGKDKSALEKSLQSKLTVSKEKMNKLAISNEYSGDKNSIKTGLIQDEVDKISKKLEKYFGKYIKAYPEDLMVKQTIDTKFGKLYKIKETMGCQLKSKWVCFHYLLQEKIEDGSLAEALPSIPEKAEYINIEHPLAKKILLKQHADQLEHAVTVKASPKKIDFSFVVSFDYFNKEEKTMDVSLPFEVGVDKAYQQALPKIDEKIHHEKQSILTNNKKLVDVELEKIRKNYQYQVNELEQLLENYEFKNQQTEEDNYFLLIPKVKKHLSKLKAEAEGVEKLTRAKMDLQTSYYLRSISIQ